MLISHVKEKQCAESGKHPFPGTWGPFYRHVLTLIPAWISNHMHRKVWDEVSYPLPNFNNSTVEVMEWISNFIPYFIVNQIKSNHQFIRTHWSHTKKYTHKYWHKEKKSNHFFKGIRHTKPGSCSTYKFNHHFNFIPIKIWNWPLLFSYFEQWWQ